MKNLAFVIVFMLIISSINSQPIRNLVTYYNWSNPTSYKVSPSPIINGFGSLSDSLSKAHSDSTFYEYNGEYYPITCWADYYLWYVNKYWYHFDQPDLYEYFYTIKDDYAMARYICDNNFTGPEYPSRIAVSFPGQDICTNNLSKSKLRKNMKSNLWENKNQVIVDNTGKKTDLKPNQKLQAKGGKINPEILHRDKIELYSKKKIQPEVDFNANKSYASINKVGPNRNFSNQSSKTLKSTKTFTPPIQNKKNPVLKNNTKLDK